MKYLTILFLSLTLLNAQAKSSEDVVTVEINCYNTNEVIKILRETYNEIPIAMGITNDSANSTMTLWISPKEKTWTITATKQNISCVIGTGTDFDFVPYKKKNTL
jgi:DNA recombination-dependent growth factor C